MSRLGIYYFYRYNIFTKFYATKRYRTMAWYDEAIFYHIYPLGMTGAPQHNTYGEPAHRLNALLPWLSHIRKIGCNALYIGPLFESVGHGYETTDYRKLDSRLGTNEDLTNFVKECHKQGIRVILDGVFNHVGRDFFAFQDVKKNRENSPYRDWFCNVNFWGNNEYNDGFTYDNWGGYNLLVKLNPKNPAVINYICDAIRFWVSEFDIDGIRLDAADVLDFDYMKALRATANTVKPDFWLMGEVIHGDYTRWVNEGTLHSVTNYHLHKALYSGHNDHNYFEIAHTVKRLYEMGGNRPEGLKLYNFVDNHDVERIYTKLSNKAHYVPTHILLYTLPGIPSLYYGSEFGIEGRKTRGTDAPLRPMLRYEDYKDAVQTNSFTKLITALGQIRQNTPALSYGDYKELLLTTRQYAFSRTHKGQTVIVTVNNDDGDFIMNIPAGNALSYTGALTGVKVTAQDGRLNMTVKCNSGEIWIPTDMKLTIPEPIIEGPVIEEPVIETVIITEEPENIPEEPVSMIEEPGVVVEDTALTQTVEEEPASVIIPADKSYEEMTIEELQEVILEKMRKNGPITDQMLRDVRENVYHSSLITWARSFY